MRKSYKTEALVGWIVGWKKVHKLRNNPHSFPRISFWIVSELRTPASIKGSALAVPAEQAFAFA
jgi:hypothetical protein